MEPQQISCFPEDGLEVLITGKITTYPARSNYQLIISQISITGEGYLLKLFEERKAKLLKEGYFNPETKKPIPKYPTSIGVITSPTGAVIQDILHRLKDRFPLPVILYPAATQGDDCPNEVISGIKYFNNLPNHQRPSLLIIARGGGSLEDLSGFNEERLVFAAYESEVPIISAIGHETDYTLLDLVADLRAPTPTAAAELSVTNRKDLELHISNLSQRIVNFHKQQIKLLYNNTLTSHKKLNVINNFLNTTKLHLTSRSERLKQVKMQTIQSLQNKTIIQSARLIKPDAYINNLKQKIESMSKSMDKEEKHRQSNLNQKITNLNDKLESYSFKKTLSRGFSIIRNDNNEIISDHKKTTNNQNIKITLHDGEVYAKITKS